jgi:hypothetical protein
MHPHWQTTRFSIDLARPRVMGIVNVTPDSFSDGGRHAGIRAALAHCERLVAEGADILDIGGESTRPGATSLAAEEELAVAYGDERLEIGFNAKYLLEIASQVDRENAVFLFNSSGDPTLMREGNDMTAVYVVMPMRV